MATSTFYDNIVIRKEAGEIMAKLAESPRAPWPKLREEEIKRGEELSEQFYTNLKKRLKTKESE